MADFYHVAGQAWDELHEEPEFPGGPSRLVAKIVFPTGRDGALIAQAFAEAMNVADVFEAESAGLPAAARARVAAALAKVRQVPRP